MNSESHTILITGVAGFIGSNLADYLLKLGTISGRQVSVIGLDNLAYGIREQVPVGVDFRQADIRGKNLHEHFTGVDTVFHFAAKNCISDCQLDPVETADINITGTANVFAAAVRQKVSKVIYAESSALYEGSSVLPTPETEVAPQSMYAISKLAGMHFAEAFMRFHGLKSTALRYFCVYGPRQDYRRTIPPVMSAFILKLLKGESPVIYGNGTKRRDFIHVDDINRFHVQCITDSRTDGAVFNLGSGTNHSVLDIYEEVGRLLKTSQPITYKPDMPGEAQDTLGDIALAQSLGWQPEFDLTRGLQTMIDYLQAEIAAGRISL